MPREHGTFGREVGESLPSPQAVLTGQGMLNLLQGNICRKNLLVRGITQPGHVSQHVYDNGIALLVRFEECFGLVPDVI